jgi:hypothetical protein
MSKLGNNIWGKPNQLVSDEYNKFTEKYNVDFYRSMYSNISNDAYLADGNISEQAAVAIKFAIDNGIPFFFFCISDGEGNCLFHGNEFPSLYEYCLARISIIHFADKAVIFPNGEYFRGFIENSIETADILCVPEISSIVKGFYTELEDIDVRAVTGNRISAQVAVVRKKPNVLLGSVWTSRHLLPYYASILSGCKHLGIISTYPVLGELLKDKWNIGQIHFHQVPTQGVFIPTADRSNTEFYPLKHHNILNKIQPVHAGMPYLVAAGLLGKEYCSVIKRRGGVAIDIGSIAEVWLGIQCRSISQDFINKWRLL